VVDGGVIPFFGAFGRPLQRPVERAQETPDVSRVILHARVLFDDARDAGQRPEVRAEAVGPRALAQRGGDAAPLFSSDPRLASRTTRGPQRRAPALSPRAIPAHDALAADPQAPSDRPVRFSTGSEQPRGLPSPNFHSVKITSGSNTSGHALHPTMEGHEIVTLLCEIQ
jgi:hypothetical protein